MRVNFAGECAVIDGAANDDTLLDTAGKAGFTLTLAAAGLWLARRLGQPGVSARRPLLALLMLVGGGAVATALELALTPPGARAAQLMGQAVRDVYRTDGPSLEAQAGDFNVSILLGGQVGNGELRLFQVYSAGNYIEATEDTPYLQIGEHKYGKPIIDRALSYDTDLGDGLKLALISMDSTMRSNLSVGMPIDLMVYRRKALKVALQRRIKDDDPYFADLRRSWSDALTQAYRAIPGPGWDF